MSGRAQGDAVVREGAGGAVEAVPAFERAVTSGAAILARREVWSDLTSATPRAILLSAVESFASRGFRATTLRHIAEGSGLSTAALYVHFRSKEQLLFEISRRGHRAALDIVLAAAELPAPGEALAALVYAFTRWHAEQRTTARVVQYEQSGLAPEHAAEIARMRRDTERAVRRVIARGVEDGTFAISEVRGASAAILSLGIDVARWYHPDGPYSPDELGRLYCDLTARMVGAGAAASASPDPVGLRTP